jgi:AbrB family looped-hinge helix DNA binding protein
MTGTTEMSKLTQGLNSKSEKMRTLAKAGYSRGDIARFLGTSYQFVRNVLVREEDRQSVVKTAATIVPSDGPGVSPNRVRVSAAGQITLPAAFRTKLGLREGDTLLVSVEGEELRLMTIPAAVRKAQAIVRQYVPQGVSLVDELLEDRRREAENETRG